MDAKEIFSKIIKFGQNNSERDELYKFCKSKLEKVIDKIPRRILHNDGANLLDCIFNGLPDNACKIKVKIIDKVLQTMRKESTSLTHCGDVISRLCLELPRLPLEHLVRWSSDSVQSIVEDSDINMIWRDILPECLNAVSLHDKVKHCGSELSGVEFKVQCVHTMCQCTWKEKQLVQLTAMFKDIQLLRTDHRQVVNKICSYMADISPDALPPLVHQLLKLCNLYNLEIVLAHLSHYFNVQLYSKLEPPPQDSESTTMDVDDIVQYSSAEMSRCLSTCLYHITQGAAEPELIRKHIKQWPKTQLLRTPFIIDLSLAISDKGADFRSVCLDVIKSAIELRILDELRSKESAWVRSVLPPDVDIVSVLKVLTTESANHRQLTVVGLINLAFSLLSVSRIKPTAQTCWSHGKLILVRLCKAQPETAGHILRELADKLFGDYTQHQYTDCLYVLCKLSPVSVERSPALLALLEGCAWPGARAYGAVRPLLPFSTRVRDALVMVCRKGLYSRDSGYRCLALSGFLTVLKYMKLSNELSSSQSGASDQFSHNSYLTQITVDMHATSQGNAITSRVRNETICLEVLSILRRCLVQDAAVKQLLYAEMYECTKEKIALHESVLELFYEHLNKYLPDDGDETSTLLISKCGQISSMSATLTEPIGWLLYVIAQFLQVEDESEDIGGSQSSNGAAFLRKKLNDIMEKLCKSDLSAEIQMDDTGLNDLTAESKAKNIKVQQVMQCYEALIAHRIMQWSPHNANANSVCTLYKAYNQLVENTKESPKAKKNKSLNETKETVKSQKSQKSQKTQKDKGKSPKKVSNLVKDRAGPFKPLPCLWDAELCVRVLDLLYGENVAWSSVEQRNHIRVRRDFHVFALRSALAALAARAAERPARPHVLRAAALLHARALCRFQDMCDFDDHTTLACLELYKTCLSLLLSPSFSLKLDYVMSGIAGSTDKPATACLAEILEKIHSALSYLEKEGAEEDLDIVRKKMLTTLVQIAILLLETPVVPCNQLIGATLQLEELVRSSKQAESLGLLSALLGAQREAALLDVALRKLTAELGVIDEDDSTSAEETSDFPTIDSRTGHMVLGQVCVHLSNRFKSAEHLLSRARDLTAALNIAVHSHQQRIDRELQELYKSIVVQLCQLTTWTSDVAKLRCCIGGGSDKVINICMRLYSLLATFFKQIEPTMVPTLRIERLLKFSGKRLSAVMDGLITYLEESSKQQQKASKVLRDTKLIPRLVLEAEQFSKHVILLGTKAKLNFQQYLSLGTARDFKIKATLLQSVVNTGERAEEKEVEDNNINDAETDILSPVASDDERNNSGDEHHSSDEEPPKNKRKRI